MIEAAIRNAVASARACNHKALRARRDGVRYGTEQPKTVAWYLTARDVCMLEARKWCGMREQAPQRASGFVVIVDGVEADYARSAM
jgi:erythromycin esterase-like protein